MVCPNAATLFLDGEDDFYVATPAAFWTAQLYLPRFQGVSLAMLRFQGFFVGWFSELAAIFLGWLPWRCPAWARPCDRRLLELLSVVSRGVCHVAGRARDGGGSCCGQQQLELSV